MPTDPNFDSQLLEIYRRYTRLREEMLPYIVETAQQARHGMPMVRPMPFFDRSDPKLRDLWDQYMFGPDLLVAPVWRVGQRERRVYLPKGRWRSYWNPQEVYHGPVTVTAAAPLDVIPLFVRAQGHVPGFRVPLPGPHR
jgi:alpha-glucosidase (family GH31 glycosyl hydrolase)